jgi:hypothetical protein
VKNNIILSVMTLIVSALFILSLYPYYSYWNLSKTDWSKIPEIEVQISSDVRIVTDSGSDFSPYYSLKSQKTDVTQPKLLHHGNLDISKDAVNEPQIEQLIGQKARVRVTEEFAYGNWIISASVGDKVIIDGAKTYDYYLSIARFFLYWFWIFVLMMGIISYVLIRVTINGWNDSKITTTHEKSNI